MVYIYIIFIQLSIFKSETIISNILFQDHIKKKGDLPLIIFRDTIYSHYPLQKYSKLLQVLFQLYNIRARTRMNCIKIRTRMNCIKFLCKKFRKKVISKII